MKNIKTIEHFLSESHNSTSTPFSNWIMPSIEDLKREFMVEHEFKGLDYFQSEDDFMDACLNSEIETITPEDDYYIDNRSNTNSYEEIISMIKHYASYPQYRNEKTVRDIYNGFENNRPMVYPIVFEDDGERFVFSGNTRMDIAFQLGINPMVLIVKV
jgi:hypothetical protein